MTCTLIGCATTPEEGRPGLGEQGGGVIGSVGGAAGEGQGGGLISVGGSSGGPVDAGGDGRPARQEKCDDAGCSCMNIASLGKFGAWGLNSNDDTTKYRDWLNTRSSATVDTLTARMPLTPTMLANYDVVILQSLADADKGAGPFWTFTADEQKALADWVSAGGGLLTMQGYGGDANEITPVNQLLQFTGMSYNSDDIFTETDRSAFQNPYCWADSTPITSWVVGDPTADAINAHITSVGAFRGRSINPGDATVFAHTNDGVKVAGAAKKIGSGAVIAFADEWITYTSQWQISKNDPNAQRCTNSYDPCYNICADKKFQVAQFWYNTIGWVSAASACPFKFNNPEEENVIPR